MTRPAYGRRRSAVRLTTTYDSLIEEVTRLSPLTWRDSARAERLIRGDEHYILHINGHWSVPVSVALGIRSYESMLGDEHHRALAAVARDSAERDAHVHLARAA